MTEEPAERRLRQVVESDGFQELTRRLDELLDHPVWWCCPACDCPISLIRSHDKRDCGLFSNDSEVREEWHAAAAEAMREAERDRVGLMTASPPDHVQVIVPVLSGNDCLGFIGIAHLPEYEQKRLPPLLSLMVEHLRQIAERVRSEEDLEGVRRLWNEVVSTLDLDVLLEKILEEILVVLDSPRGVLLLTDPDKQLVPRKTLGVGCENLEFEPGFPSSVTPFENKMKNWREPARPLPEGDPLRDWFLGHCGGGMDGEEVWGIPLLHQGKLFGLVLCIERIGKKLSSRRQASLETLALGSSVAIRNAMEFETMRQKSVALSTVHSVYRLMSSTRVASDLLHRMANLTLQVLNSRKCSIMLSDSTGRLHPCVAIGLAEGEIGTRSLDLGEGIPGLAAEEETSLRVFKPREDPRFANDPAEFYPAESYLSVPLFEEEVVGVITLGDRLGSPSRYTIGDREVLNTLAEQAVIALMNIQYFEKQERIALSTMGTFENLFETGDPDKEGRSQRLAALMSGIAESISIDEQTRQSFQMAAYLQNLGRIGAAPKEGAPVQEGSEEARRIAMAIRLARRMELPDSVAPILRDHLEHFDGTGRPRGLRGDEIPLGARLLTLSEAYLGLLHPKNGEVGLTVEEALARIEEGSGTRYDPNLVEAIKKYVGQSKT